MSVARLIRALLGNYPNTVALRDSRVSSPKIEWAFDAQVPVHDAFGRAVNNLAFDVSELAVVTFLQAKSAGVPLSLLPIAVLSRFQHQFLVADVDRPRQPEQLIGARIGVRSYSVTTAVWLRGLLEDDYGVPADSVTWVAATSAHLTGYRDPVNVERMSAGQTLEQRLEAGGVDAAVLGTPAAPLGARATVPVIENAEAVAAEWFRRHGFVPINHVLAVTSDLVTKAPDLVAEIYRMAAEARAIGLGDPTLVPGVPGVTAADALSIGIESLRPGLELISRYAAAQHIIPASIAVDDMFGDVLAVVR